MTVKDIWSPDENERKELIKAMSLNHDVKKKEDKQELTGDPTEVALVTYAREHNHFEESWEVEHPREDELPFDADRKAMTTIHKVNGKYQ
ncbi:MAG: hypothetical protein WDO71_19680 [Bacteroidota bacterium]